MYIIKSAILKISHIEAMISIIKDLYIIYSIILSLYLKSIKIVEGLSIIQIVAASSDADSIIADSCSIIIRIYVYYRIIG